MRAMLLLTAICYSISAQTHTGTFDRTLSVSGPVELDLTTDSGGIVVTPGSSGSVRIHAVLKAHRGEWSAGAEDRIRALERNPPIEQIGNRIRVGYVADRTLLKGVSMRLEIQTPPETSVKAEADSGGVRVEGVNGPIECETDSGGIEAANIGSDVRAQADSGGIRLRAIRGSVFARADSGGIEAMDIAGTVDAQTDSGGIRITQSAAAPVVARADSGGANIKLAAAAGYDLNVASSSGRITVPEMTVSGNLSRHRAAGKIRGGGPLVDVKVDSGNVVVE